MIQPPPPRWSRRRTVVELAIGACGCALLVGSTYADARWFERHVLIPHYFVRPLWLPLVTRVGAAAIGAVLLVMVRQFVGRRVDRWSAAARGAWTKPGGRAVVLGSLLALPAALLAGEGILRLSGQQAGGSAYGAWRLGMLQSHPRFGWRSRPSRTTTLKVVGRPYTHAVNALGSRSRSQTDVPNLVAPSLVVAGESVAAGIGLEYEETFAALCGRKLGLETVIVAEGGYSVDQAYLRLIDVLPRLQRPAVVVTVFVPAQLARSLKGGRPYLEALGDGQLRLRPAPSGFLADSRLWRIVRDGLPVTGEGALQHAVVVTRAILRAAANAARERGARPLFVILGPRPSGSPDTDEDAWLIHALFETAGLPYLLVDLDSSQVIPRDGHPNAAGAGRIAGAIEAALRDSPDP